MVRLVLSFLVLHCLAACCFGHSYLTKPRPRDPYFGACRIGGPPEWSNYYCTGPCELDYSPTQAHTDVARGSPYRVEWPRNNHPGGFIRLAWLPAEQAGASTSQELFDGNVQQYSCHEVGCQADAGAGADSGDSNPADGSANACYTDITIPLHLTDGVWTMQWSWYGGSHGYLGDYYSCANFRVEGGPTGPQLDPVFVGGDVSNPGGSVCEYWTTDRLHQCVSEPCSDICNDNFSPLDLPCGGKRNGAPYINPLLNQSPPPSSSPVVPPVPDPVKPDFEVVVIVSVSLNVDSKTFDPVIFAYDVTDLLKIPIAAIKKVEINLDQSTATTTYVTFSLINAVDGNGVPINPLAKANELKDIAASNDPILSQQYNLSGLAVLGADELEPSTSSVCLPAVGVVLAALLALV